VAGDHQQDKSEYESIFSPTVATSTAFIIASLAAREERSVECIDIAGAYLNVEMSAKWCSLRSSQYTRASCVIMEP